MMKKFTIALLGVIFVTLIAGSIQSISADHLEPGQGIFKNERAIEFVPTNDSNYQIYLQTVLRNGDGQLISVAEGMHGFVIPHQVTDHVFDTLMGKKEIITIDNIKYEKAQYTFSPTLEQRYVGMYPIFSEIPIGLSVGGDALAHMNEEIKDYSIWKIHYCGEFPGIGHDDLQCIPVFQVLVPTVTLEPDDVITQQWTILRVLN